MDNQLIYLDTNVLMDFLMDRNSFAYSLIRKSLKCYYTIVISNLVFEELRFNNFETEAINISRLLNDSKKLVSCIVTDNDIAKAKLLTAQYKTHFSDALHKVLFIKSGAKILVTQNVRDFVCFHDIKVLKPDAL